MFDTVPQKFNLLFKSKYSRPYMVLLKKFSNADLTPLNNIISFNIKRKTINIDTSYIRDIVKNSIDENNNVITLKIKILIERQLKNMAKENRKIS